MARIKINLPKEVKFSTEVPIRISDINYGGHVGNDSILTIMHEIRLQYFKFLGFESEVDIVKNIGIIVADVAISYKSESFYGDILEAQVFVDDFNKYGFDLYYLLRHKETRNEIARGKTGIVCYNYVEKKLATVPAILTSKVN